VPGPISGIRYRASRRRDRTADTPEEWAESGFPTRNARAERPENAFAPLASAYINGKGYAMNLYEMLHQDHEKAKTLFGQLEATGNDQERRREQLFAALFLELDVHTLAEERFFYSQLKGEDQTHELTLESLDDHKQLKRMLSELDSMDKGSPEWIGRCRILRDSVERHVEMEERELFPLARKVLEDEEAAGIAEDIESYKEEHTELEAY
jgi:hemerythrin-like domain-containing protein